MSGLAETQRQVLRLSYFKQLTYAEIAVELGLSMSRVKDSAAGGLRGIAQRLDPGYSG